MAAFTYTARRSLIAGHFAGTDYSLDIRLLQADSQKRILRVDQETMDGSPERLYHGATRTWNCVTVSVPPNLRPFVQEFLDSIEDGQEFTADLYGSIVVAREPLQVYRSDAAGSAQRTVRVGGGGHDDYFRYPFQVREL